MCRGSHSFGQGSYSGLFSGQKSFTLRSYFGYEDPGCLIWQCSFQTHSGPYRTYSAALVRDSAPSIRGRGGGQTNRGGRTLDNGALVLHYGDRGDRRAQCYVFPRRPNR